MLLWNNHNGPLVSCTIRAFNTVAYTEVAAV